MIFPWEADTLWFAVDSAQLRAGIAWRAILPTGKVEIGTLVIEDIMRAHEAEPVLRAVAARAAFAKVVVAVEYPHWNAGASPQVRGAANGYVRMFKAIFPRVLKHVKVDPNDWQKKLLANVPGSDTKERAVFVAGRIYGYDVEGDKERADAACILEYLRADPTTAAALTKARNQRNKCKNPNPKLPTVRLPKPRLPRRSPGL